MSNNNKNSVIDKNIVIIDAEVLRSVHYDLTDLAKLLEDVISDLSNAKGGQQLRHSYILYRDRIDAVKDKLNKNKLNGTE